MSVELFEQKAAVVLSALYINFPHKMRIAPNDIAALEGQASANSQPDQWPVYTDTIGFLAAEGFIRHGEPHVRQNRGERIIDTWPDLVLTAKGLALLNATPKCLSANAPEKPLGERMGEAVKSGTTTVISALVREIINASVKLLGGGV